MEAQVVLKDKQSTYSGPYGFYTVTLTPYERTKDSVKVLCEVSARLQYAESFVGYWVKCGLYIGGRWTDFNIYDGGGIRYDDGTDNGKLWKGTSPRTASVTITIPDLAAAQTAITGIKFRAVHQTGASGPGLADTACTDLSLDCYGGLANVDGKDALVWVNDNGVWKHALVWVNDDGTWRSSV